MLSHVSITVMRLPPTLGVKRRIGVRGRGSTFIILGSAGRLSAFLCTSAGADTDLVFVLLTRVAATDDVCKRYEWPFILK